MRRVKPIRLTEGISAGALVREYGNAGVLGAGDLGRAADILEEMVRREAKVFLGISGPLVPSGLREVIVDMIRNGYVHVVVTSGANVVHDMIEAFRGGHYVGSFDAADAELRKKEIGRIGNVYARASDFRTFETRVLKLLRGIPAEKRADLSARELLWEIGSRLKDEGSFLRAAWEKKVPVFSPALIDSMLGLQLFMFSQRERIVLNAVKDLRDIVDATFEARSTGALFLGGGVPKHYIMMANTLRNGLDYGVQITMDREEAGSLSGAKLEEGISWGKVKGSEKVASLVGDVTVLLPLLVAALKERLPGKSA